MARSCLQCGASDDLTKHHLLPDASRRKMGDGRGGKWIWLCWSCHLPLHRGGKQAEAWERLWPLLTEADRRYILDHREPGTVFASRLPGWITP